jgi:hypothetical protein
MKPLTGKIASGIARLTSSGGGEDDPLTSLKAAARWVGNLPLGDAFKCQEVIFSKLRDFNEKTSGFMKDRLAVLMLLDEKSQDLQDTLVRQYLRNPRMSRSVESQLWHAVYGLYWEVARGYHSFILDFSRGAGKQVHESQVPLITLRALRTFGQLLKWRAIRYLPAGEKLWLRLHNLYRIAENEGFSRRSLQAYAGDASPHSCEATYLHILMLHLANSGTLYPKQLDQLDQWLAGWQGLLELDRRYDPQTHNFVIDLSSDHGPRRVRKPDTSKPLRYWSSATLLLKLDGLNTALREGAVPAQLGLSENARSVESLELLEHLQHNWSALSSREQRRAPRAPVKRLVDVTHGLGTLIAQIKIANTPVEASPYGTGLNASEVDDVRVYGFVTDRTRERTSLMRAPTRPDAPDVERWVMQDESLCGYGAIVKSRDKDWLRVGALVGVKSSEDGVWQLGIVRRLSRLDDDTSSVGIETLADTPTLAMLYDTATSAGYTVDGVDGVDNSGADLPRAALWLASSVGADSMVIDPVYFKPDKVFQVHGNGGKSFVALGRPLERSEGWMRVAVKPVTR